MSRRRRAALLAAVAVAAALLIFLSGDDGEDGAGDRPAEPATRAHAVVTAADGRAVAAIERLENGRWRPALGRERDDGTLDPRFADLPIENPAGLVEQSDGKLLVAGDRIVDGRRRLAVARLTAAGRPDPSFGNRGVATVPAGDGDAVARGIAVEDDRDVVVVGDAVAGDDHFIAVARIGGDGRGSSVDPIDGASAGGAATDREGNVLVAGTDTRDGAAVLARLRPGRPAAVTRGPTRLTSASWRAVAAAPDGGAIVVGSGRGSGARSLMAVQRFGPDGAVTGSAGIAAGDGDAFGAAVAVERDGGVAVGGTGVERDRPAAFVVALGPAAEPAGSPRRKAAGQLAGLARGGIALATEWTGQRLSATLAR